MRIACSLPEPITSWPIPPSSPDCCSTHRVEVNQIISTVILTGMTYRVGAKGQVVIPKTIRDLVGLHPGDDVEFSVENDEVILRRATPRTELRGRYQGTDLTGALLRERSADRSREDDR